MSIRRLSRRGALAATAATTLAAVLLAGCATNTTTAASTGDAAGAPGTGGTAIGFIFVGPKDDYGYNQAAYAGSQAVAAAYPDLEVLTAENVPEDDNATRVMESMIRKGAKIIFATSYGHKDPALKVAAANPDVVVLQQGNIVDGDLPPNFGTYFGTVYEPVYLAGIVAGKTTKTNKLGYVYAFPISQTLDNINAFQLGAASVNPDAKTYVVNTSSWCDPAKQAEATNSLLSQGVDVISQHQDCTATIIRTTEAAGAYTVGYHADASELAPTGWLTGSEWDWGPLYTKMVETMMDGEFTGSEYNANFRVGLKTGDNPFVQSAYGPAVDEETKDLVEQAKAKISAEDGSPFAGPVVDQAGTVRVPADTIPDYQTIESIDYFVDGVVGQIPSS
ncbi:BMP family ABC transporter substrate-binding protein [Solwaraspora sp. WMMA2056]|uniref:BMP family ABC transporter substrate-binding protein n=1 Tax=Solwaraspora sp. WMMA2056 TaxID=3015161 RepID=UPI00259B21C8|nr:BMP family ABC transporter substrate-binding protein [Solwaraspora sp. WMMA2056]WJK43156.1 BMP family ABC transporter substrate-binding protein [Solwaraspora sp. WMMA2056]